MAKKIKRLLPVTDTIHCACLIHDIAYDWIYVDKLYNSLCRHLTPQVILHVYTESNRHVPEPYVRHDLEEWPNIRGPKSSWWYKIQLFNPKLFKGHLLYFDLDTVITSNIDWIWQQNHQSFWAVKDFKYLFKSRRQTINSSVMWFSTEKYSYIYSNFDPAVAKRHHYHGDQDYINEQIPDSEINYLDIDKIKSWKWQIKNGGYNFKTRKYFLTPEQTSMPPSTSVLVFHGKPKPHEEQYSIVIDNWK